MKIEGWGCLLGQKTILREGQLEELVGDQNPSPEAPPRSKRGGSKGNIRGGTTARGAMEKCRYVRVVEGGKSRNTSLPCGQKYLLSLRRSDGN